MGEGRREGARVARARSELTCAGAASLSQGQPGERAGGAGREQMRGSGRRGGERVRGSGGERGESESGGKQVRKSEVWNGVSGRPGRPVYINIEKI